MTDAPQANPQGLVPLGAIAARNIALTLNLAEEHVATIEKAIRDEIGMMSSHFTMAFADIQTQYEIELAKLRKDGTEVAASLKAEYDKQVAELRSTFGL